VADEFDDLNDVELLAQIRRRGLPDDGDRETKLERLRAWQNDANRSLTDEEIRQKYQLPGAPFVWKRGA
jgi:hypothetical protein